MQIKSYRVFGSGTSCRWFSHTSDNPGMLLAALESLLQQAINDGDNGFVGHYSVPDELAKTAGIKCIIQHSPPYNEFRRPGPGWVTLSEARTAVKLGLSCSQMASRNEAEIVG